MTLSQGCCGPQALAYNSHSEHSTPRETLMEHGSSNRCGSVPVIAPSQLEFEHEFDVEDDCKPDLFEPPSCQKSCCTVPVNVIQHVSGSNSKEAGGSDKCCAGPTTELVCSAAPIDPIELQLMERESCSTSEASCCEGKPSPCCDQSCLDRLALRERESCDGALTDSPSLKNADASSNCVNREMGESCAERIRKTLDQYTEMLETLGCICRSLIAIGQESCCSPHTRSLAESTRRRSKDRRLRPRGSSYKCCSNRSGPRAGTCSTPQGSGSRKACRPYSANEAKPRPSSMAECCADADCVKQPCAGTSKKSMSILHNEERATADPEKGFPSHDKEHVILSISGMTCTGCERKLVRTLGTHPSVRNLKTSLLLSRAEFDLVGVVSVTEIMKHLERTTEFKCEKVANQGSSLDVIAPGSDAAAVVTQRWPNGVTDMRVVDKTIVNISFDASVHGARDLIERGWGDRPMTLAPLRLDQTLEAGNKHVRHLGYTTFLSACLTIPVLVMAWAPLPKHPIEYASASLALATLVQAIIIGPFYPKVIKAIIFSRIIEMDLLVILSTSVAFIFSVVSFGFMVAGQPLSTGEFFETSTLLATLIMVGRWVSALSRQKAVESLSIRSFQITTACLVTDNGETEIDSRLLQYGDVFKVAPDCRIPTDGTVILGSSEVDESMITGESRPVEKHLKSPVIAGTVNGSGILHVRLTRLPGDNTISTIASMVDEAKLSKPKIQDVADRVATFFVPVVIAITIITFCIWIAIGLEVRGQTGSESTIEAITFAITVLIVSCPCAIGLAVPMVIVVASGAAAERGVIFKSAETIEVAHRTSHVVFDKTGTLTEGKLTVAREWYSVDDPSLSQSLLLGMLESIKHPVSAAVVKHLKAHDVTPLPVSAVKTLTGKGVEGTAEISGLILKAGNSRWLELSDDTVVQSFLSQGYTAFCFTIAGSIAAIFGLNDSLRPDAIFTVKTLLDRGVSVHIISGDDDGPVSSIAAELYIAERNIRSRCTPADKQAYIRGLLDDPALGSHGPTRREKAEKPVVMFCGDGTNDAVALAQATIGVHMNEGGTDVAKSASDVVLMRPNLVGILIAITVSKKAMNRVFFNFGWSFVYNLFAILLAAGAFVNARIPPEFAGLGELVSVLPVIAAAMQLRWSSIPAH